MSDQVQAWAVVGDYGTLLCVSRQYAEADAATRRASGELGVHIVELVEVVRCADCRIWTRNPGRADRGTCVHQGYTDGGWYCPSGSRR